MSRLVHIWKSSAAGKSTDPVQFVSDEFVAEWKAARPHRPTADQTWKLLQKIAESGVPGVRREFLAAVRALRAALPLAAIEDALLRQDTDALMRLLPWEDFATALERIPDQVAKVQAESFRVAGERAAVQLNLPVAAVGQAPRPAVIGVSFDVVSPQVVDAIRTRAATRIVEVTEETQAAVRELVARGYESGRHPREVARDIRREVGLTRRQSEAVARYRTGLDVEKVGQARADRMVDRYAAKLHRERAETIARTEAIQGMNDGQGAQWEQLVRDGLLDPEGWVQEWLAVIPNGRTCPRCVNMDGRQAPIGGLFEGDPKGPIAGPTLHPKCRCSKVLKQVTAVAVA